MASPPSRSPSLDAARLPARLDLEDAIFLRLGSATLILALKAAEHLHTKLRAALTRAKER